MQLISFPSDDEWNWLFSYNTDGGRVVHEEDEERDEYGNQSSEIETDSQYGSIDRFGY
jgi:hypothetical protein